MKKVKYSWILLLFSAIGAKAQYIIAGTPGAVYVDIVPDTTIASVIANAPASFYFIDINQDGIKDIEIETIYSYMSLHSQYYDREVDVFSQNSSVSFFQGKYIYSTSCQSQSTGIYTYTPHNTTLLKMFNLGDTIRDDTSFTSGKLQYLNDQSPPIGNHCYDDWGLWDGAGDKYFGVKFKNATDSTYGWVKVNVGFGSCKIEEFSLAVALLGIEEKNREENLIRIFPNPSSNTISINVSGISNYENSTITIQNTLGETARKISFTKNINVSDLAEGCYFLQVVFQSGEVYKTKFIKQ